jgi:hypothetical protein
LLCLCGGASSQTQQELELAAIVTTRFASHAKDGALQLEKNMEAEKKLV